MHCHEYYDEEPEPEHPIKRERPQDIASLFVMKAELADLRSIVVPLGSTIVGVKQVTPTPSFLIEVLCPDSEARFALDDAWATYCAASPHRPHTKEEVLALAERGCTNLSISRDWRF